MRIRGQTGPEIGGKGKAGKQTGAGMGDNGAELPPSVARGRRLC